MSQNMNKVNNCVYSKLIYKDLLNPDIGLYVEFNIRCKQLSIIALLTQSSKLTLFVES